MPGLTEAMNAAIAELDDDAAPQPDDGEDTGQTDEQTEDGTDDAEPAEADEVDAGDAGEEPDDGDDADADGDDDGEQPEAVEVDPETTYTLSDGTQVQGSELRDGYLRQADYTRKTQQLAAQRKKVEQREQQVTEWLNGVKERPADAVLEVAQQSEQPLDTFAQALVQAGNPTGDVALLLRRLGEQGQLDPDFAQHFGIEQSDTPVGQRAQQTEYDERIKRLEQREKQSEEEQRRQQLVQEYHQQWDSIKQQAGIDFGDDPQQEQQAKIELMKFARDRQIPDLEDAYAVMESRGEGFAGRQAQERQKRQQQTRQQASQAAEKKRKQKAQSRHGARQQAPPPSDGPRNLNNIIEGALAEKGI